jgi:nucleotide-binding universal stress UspA family protein
MRRTVHLPVLTFPHAPTPRALDAALQAAQVVEADLSATLYSADLPSSSASIAGLVIGVSDMIAKVENDSRATAEALAATIRQLAEGKGVTAEVETRAAPPTDAREALVRAARYHDLVLLPWDPDNLTGKEVAEAMIFGSGRPSLIVPEGCTMKALRHVTVAWDGSRVAARALADALPLLADTARLTVLTVDDDKALEPEVGIRLAEALRRKGFDADHRALSGKGRPIAQTLQEASGQLSADLLVMGGYGHSRMRDFIVGGATLGVLANPTLPVLVSH